MQLVYSIVYNSSGIVLFNFSNNLYALTLKSINLKNGSLTSYKILLYR